MGLPSLVLDVQRLGAIDVALLSALSAAAKQNNERIAILRQMDSEARAPINDAFADTRKPLHAGSISKLHA